MADKLSVSQVGHESGIMADAMAIYKPPFFFRAGYIFDDEGNIFADMGSEDDRQARIARIRGWGRISYMDKPEELQDAVGKQMAIALTEYWEKHNTK